MKFYLYVLKRLFMAFVVAVVIIVVLALATRLVPGDPVLLWIGDLTTAEIRDEVRQSMGLDDPAHVQVWEFLSGVLTGDFGTNIRTGQPITDEFTAALPHTAVLAMSSMALAAIVGIPLGVYVAARPNGVMDRLLGLLSIALITIPVFVILLALLVVFAVQLQWVPAIGGGSFSEPVDYARRLILPAFALALPLIGSLPRLIRGSMLEVMSTEFIRTARSFGLRERVVFYKYALKNALIPTVALLGLSLGSTLTGTVFAETIFVRQGIGRMAEQAISTLNWPQIRATVLLFTLFIVLSNLVADLSYRFLDPRIRLEEGDEAPG